MKAAFRERRGVTLVELMIVLMVLGVLLSLALPSLADLLNRRRVQMVADQLTTDLAYARSESGIALESVSLRFMSDATQSCYSILYFGTIGGCECTRGAGSSCINTLGPGYTNFREIRTTQVPRNSGVSLQTTGSWDASSVDRVRFLYPQMTPTVPDFAVIVRGRGFTLKVQLNAMGRATQCTPDGSMPGAPAC
ncbi:Tfp pilus assembly protein FimT/FimU [Paucibacter sp. DJ2R-2]|uniref:pilus assembly FimT family protein n=1 Tax=Paucibacter sp. DJ2R-2 TaxID=2893558 RepID=UPI0021E440D1|nr:prepilin-type N-terminal cleavage/methylation domain-containing protein [Paucibacter sp. DJ2R-2]MCV2422963.1 prepilin-type N-terminal cleavage/methylation domain-containing protein [Paucibacter sp. DJ4R-1]MCV2440859.1 prepilin-type N-terminal cleavage/methylation domain-containing protein [Paucibacter sp. DJ2R-2]